MRVEQVQELYANEHGQVGAKPATAVAVSGLVDDVERFAHELQTAVARARAASQPFVSFVYDGVEPKI